MRKFLVLVSCAVAAMGCSNPHSSGYLSGAHQVSYTVTVASGAAMTSSGPGSLTMSIWIDGVQKYTATTSLGAPTGANATVSVQSPLI